MNLSVRITTGLIRYVHQMLIMNNTNERLLFTTGVLNYNLSPQRMLEMYTLCSSKFSGKITKSLLFHVWCCGRLCSCVHCPPQRCYLQNEVQLTENGRKHEIRTRTGSVRNADPVLNDGSVVRSRAGFVYSHGTRAKADVRIRTLRSRSASHLFNCIQYRLKNPNVLKSPDSQEKWRESVDILSKTDVKNALKLLNETRNRDQILGSRPVKNPLKM